MKRIFYSQLIVLLIVIPFTAGAQNTMYFMERLPQTQDYNPAFIPEARSYFSLPMIGNVRTEIYNSGFSMGQFIDYNNKMSDSNYNPDEFISKIGDFNKTYIETRIDFFSMGFRVGRKNYISISSGERNFLEMNAPSNFFYLLEEADNIRDKMPLTINNTKVSLNTFSQLSLTWSRQIGERLTVGISPKIIFAICGVKSDNFGVTVNQEEEDYIPEFRGSILVGLPVKLNPEAIRENGEYDRDKNPVSDDWNNFRSQGNVFSGSSSLALDLGANLKINDKLSVAASLTDIGASRWGKYGSLWEAADTTFKIQQNKKFSMTIPRKFYTSVKYQFSPRWDAGFLFRNIYSPQGCFNSATISLNGLIGKMMSASVSYSAGYNSGNLGLGLRLRFLPGTDLYAVTDNLPVLFDYRSIRHVSVAFGINVALYQAEKEKAGKKQSQEAN